MASEIHAPSHLRPGQGPRTADGHHAGSRSGRGPETGPLQLPWGLPHRQVRRVPATARASGLMPTGNCLTLVQSPCPEPWGLSNAQDDRLPLAPEGARGRPTSMK